MKRITGAVFLLALLFAFATLVGCGEETKLAADKAARAADDAKAAAERAEDTAKKARNTADNAADAAGRASDAADKANRTAEEAEKAARTASGDAENAKAAAENAGKIADGAVTAAETAIKAAKAAHEAIDEITAPPEIPPVHESLKAKRAEIEGYIKIFEDFYSNVHKEILPNGMTVLVKEKHTAPVAFVLTLIKTGSVHEADYYGAGISHFNEHLLFRNIEEFKDKDGKVIYPAIKGKGTLDRMIAGMGGWDNAYTSTDKTVYIMKVLAEYVEKAIRRPRRGNYRGIE